jgi:hypothetical protein
VHSTHGAASKNLDIVRREVPAARAVQSADDVDRGILQGGSDHDLYPFIVFGETGTGIAPAPVAPSFSLSA